MKTKHVVGILMMFGMVSAHCQTFTNGSFEVPAKPENGSFTFTNVSGWTTGGAQGVWLRRGSIYYFPTAEHVVPVDGQQQVLFENGGGWIEQSFTTSSNEDYEISFRMGIVGVSGGIEYITATVYDQDGTELKSKTDGTFGGLPLPRGYKPEVKFIFTAKSDISKIRFADQSWSNPLNAAQTVLDHVKISPALVTANIEVSQVKVFWNALTNHVYQVQYRSALSTNQWLNLGDPINGSSGTNFLYDLTGSQQKFYRVLKVQ